MESRRNVHNNRSKVTSLKKEELKKSKKNRFKITFEKKNFETMQCQWCDLPFSKKSIYCIRCKSCQYCGMLIYNPNRCHVCGNEGDNYGNIKMKKFKIY